MDYLDFEIRIKPGDDGRYPVHVIDAPDAERPTATMVLPFDEGTLKSHLQNLQIALLQSKSTRRALVQPQEQLSVKEFGQVLFDTVLPDDVRACYQRSRNKAAASGKGLRLRLRIEAPDLAALPWEFLYDKAAGDFVCLSNETPIVRYLALDRPVAPIRITPPLQILGMVAAPDDKPQLNVAREKQRMSEALAGLEARGLVRLTWLEGQTWQELQRAMRQGPWHIFHFVGHGGFDPAINEGVLAFAKEDRQTGIATGGDATPPTRTDPLPATKIGQLLADHRDLRLVVLNACQGATASTDDIFSSTASVLIRKGIPAVVAMQYEITDRAAIEFGRGFYASVADGLPVDASVAEARKAVNFAMDYTVEWGTPVLHMRAPDGRLFDIDALATAPPAPPPPDPVVEVVMEPEPTPTPRPAEAPAPGPARSARAAAVPPEASGKSKTLLWGVGAGLAVLVVTALVWRLWPTPDPELSLIARVAIDLEAETLTIGETVFVQAWLWDADGEEIDNELIALDEVLTWSAEPEGIVAFIDDVEGFGVYAEALRAGTVTITASVSYDASFYEEPPADAKRITVEPEEEAMVDMLPALFAQYLDAQRLFNDPDVSHDEVAAAYAAFTPDDRVALEDADITTQDELDAVEAEVSRLAEQFDETWSAVESDTLTLLEQRDAWLAYLSEADPVRSSPSTTRAVAAADSLSALAEASPSLVSLHTCSRGGLDCPASAQTDTFDLGQPVYFSAKLNLPAREVISWEWIGPAGDVLDEGSDTFQAAPGYRTYQQFRAADEPGRYDLRLYSEAGHLIGRRVFVVQ